MACHAAMCAVPALCVSSCCVAGLQRSWDNMPLMRGPALSCATHPMPSQCHALYPAACRAVSCPLMPTHSLCMPPCSPPCSYVLTQFQSHALNSHIAASYPPLKFGAPDQQASVGADWLCVLLFCTHFAISTACVLVVGCLQVCWQGWWGHPS